MENILNFWFDELNQENDFMPPNDIQKKWWMKSEEFDKAIKDNFLTDIYNAATQKYDVYLESPRGRLAVIILLDQFTRNVFRDTYKMYAFDNLALYHSLQGIELGQHLKLHPIERVFMYMPLEHSEDIKIQNLCVELFKELEETSPDIHKNLFKSFTEFAIKHQVIINKFNRFPHRNKILCRQSTSEELTFLQEPDSKF